jgi:hypothetical protein
VPERIQRRRTAGWRTPEGAVYVGRPTKWGNPWTVHQHTDRCDAVEHLHCPLYPVDAAEGAVRRYRYAIAWPLSDEPRVPDPHEIRAELAGKDLVCWCPLDQPCHADVLLEIANGGGRG